MDGGQAEAIRVRGLVQGVGFRPTVWRLAQALNLIGDVRNDGDGVLIRIQPADAQDGAAIDRFCARLRAECPPLARIDAIERIPLSEPLDTQVFQILASDPTPIHTGIVPDAATCPDCLAEIQDPTNRRYRYPFANCTHCGPRLSIVRGIPYDRARTSMVAFALCARCRAEYEDPADRRFHAQPTACPDCGPRVWLVDARGQALDAAVFGACDAIEAASRLLREGQILAIKGIGGFHLACDATATQTVAELRRRKRRDAKPLALMARDLEIIQRYAQVSPLEAQHLMSPSAPILLLIPRQPPNGPALAPGIAPDQYRLGFMLPYSPLHHLLLADWERPLVMTSGNLSDEPPCIDNAEALERLGGIADFLLLHDRAIINRVDDSLASVMDGELRLLRRARGYAPSPIRLPPGFEDSGPILALGGELKNCFCLIREGQALLSPHLGDLEGAGAAREYRAMLGLYTELFTHRPQLLAIDRHPDYHPSHFGRDWARREGLNLISVQHHHAHLAAVLADNGWPRTAGPVLGILLDGLGWGEDGTLWGGECLVGDYYGYRRVAHLRPVLMPGGALAIREPWRMLLAWLESTGGWTYWQGRYPELPPIQAFRGRPVSLLLRLIAQGPQAPFTSSAGRLFDAVAAALGLGGERLSYEGQAACALESLAMQAQDPAAGYPFKLDDSGPIWQLDPSPLWEALLSDLAAGTAPASIAARFHHGFASALVETAVRLSHALRLDTLALSGGVWQNRLLFESVTTRLRAAGLRVLTHRQVPTNDGGLALGQGCVAAALALAR
ncbi:carbamoyltransferase HypF [Caldichromatium japonicum]|uniref:Carbamoyltransferase HypF n=1 Tax=Caldichromatium japonicum TaxID=2699430 RepID=A0A6G7VDY7_9GAMM|nr:carbamoyltransferase HypF [Caldichromatium japonicum]QIK38184.1 carbamoyltransferase HypF [Caldichromatium japonicum]